MQELVVSNREELIYLLNEAAEIEHGLMCTYLYAAWSLKSAADGLTDAQADAVERWRGTIRDVAVDEMLHLAQVSNLLTAVGAPPHLGRQNLPVAPGSHPGALVVRLAPFDAATIDHFVYLERPDTANVADGAGFDHGHWVRPPLRPWTLMATAQDYPTVGHFYRSLRRAFRTMADRLGEAELFCGDPHRQVGPEILDWEGLEPVTDVASAERAIDLVVSQGEGSPGHTEGSHYDRFCGIRDELEAMRRIDPSFEPAFRCAQNPVQKPPVQPNARTHVTHAPAARLLDLGNAIYNLMLRTLAQGLGGRSPADVRRAWVDTAIEGMKILEGVARGLARLPADPVAHPGVHAGLSFAITRSIPLLVDDQAAPRIIDERYQEIIAACASIDDVAGVAQWSAARLENVRRGLPNRPHVA